MLCMCVWHSGGFYLVHSTLIHVFFSFFAFCMVDPRNTINAGGTRNDCITLKAATNQQKGHTTSMAF